MIEDELRTLLSDRAGDLPVNGRRAAEVRRRIAAVRRRRAGAAALALVLVALTGAVLTRLPGRPDPLPVGVPPGPWFPGPDPVAAVPGYLDVSDRYFGVDGTADDPDLTRVVDGLRYLVVVRCQRRGVLTVRNPGPGGASAEVDCSRPAGDEYEGVLALDAARARPLLEPRSAGDDLRVTAAPPGRWDAAVLESRTGDRLLPFGADGRPLLDGTGSPAGGSFPLRVPAGPGLGLGVDCVAGVVLEFTVAGRALATADCDPSRPRSDPNEFSRGTLRVAVPPDAVRRAGLRAGGTVRVTVRSTGRDTDQWRISAAG